MKVILSHFIMETIDASQDFVLVTLGSALA